jgi:adenylate cyclase class IV
LGSFLEIEVIDETGAPDLIKMKEQCHYYMDLLEIKEVDLFENSYSDMVLSTITNHPE